jgi:hypothetical protein
MAGDGGGYRLRYASLQRQNHVRVAVPASQSRR